jgi:hypothetical protein
LIDLEAILAATAPPTTLRSAEENKLGEGGFGPVYLVKIKKITVDYLPWQTTIGIVIHTLFLNVHAHY